MTPKVALVTGASSGGIGYSLCVSLRACSSSKSSQRSFRHRQERLSCLCHGSKYIVRSSWKQQNHAKASRHSSIEGLKEFGCDVFFAHRASCRRLTYTQLLQLDVTSRESLEAAVKHVSMETSGRLNALYCNAGAAADNIPVLEVDLDAARSVRASHLQQNLFPQKSFWSELLWCLGLRTSLFVTSYRNSQFNRCKCRWTASSHCCDLLDHLHTTFSIQSDLWILKSCRGGFMCFP